MDTLKEYNNRLKQQLEDADASLSIVRRSNELLRGAIEKWEDKVRKLRRKRDEMSERLVRQAGLILSLQGKVKDMEEDVDFLYRLKGAGVDNWVGYDDAFLATEDE